MHCLVEKVPTNFRACLVQEAPKSNKKARKRVDDLQVMLPIAEFVPQLLKPWNVFNLMVFQVHPWEKVTLLCVKKEKKGNSYLSRRQEGGEMPFGGSWFHPRDVFAVENLWGKRLCQCLASLRSTFLVNEGRTGWVVELGFLWRFAIATEAWKITLDQTQLSGLVDPWPYQNNDATIEGTQVHRHDNSSWEIYLDILCRAQLIFCTHLQKQLESTNLTLAAWHESRCATATSTVGPKRLCSHFRCVDDPGAQPWMGLISMPFLARRMKSYHRRPQHAFRRLPIVKWNKKKKSSGAPCRIFTKIRIQHFLGSNFLSWFITK